MAYRSISYFHNNILETWKDDGQAWLDSLPELINKLSQDWQLTNLIPANNLSYNYVMYGKQNNSSIILKLGFDQHEVAREYQTLKAYDGNRSIGVLDYSKKHSALLLECALPGAPLAGLFPHYDEKSIHIMIEIMHKLHKTTIPKKHTFPSIENWLSILDKPHKKIESEHLHKARVLRDKLLSSQTKSVLLHGDLHHDNILSHGNSWIAIDPKGVIGEPAFEVGAFIKNPIPGLREHPDKEAIIDNRLKLFSKFLGIAHERLKDWFFVQSIMYKLFS